MQPCCSQRQVGSSRALHRVPLLPRRPARRCHKAVPQAAAVLAASIGAQEVIGRSVHHQQSYIPHVSLHAAFHGASHVLAPLWFASCCALSIAIGALFFNLFTVLRSYTALQDYLANYDQDATIIHGVDITRSRLLHTDAAQRALQFAERAHAGQYRKTGEPYVAHCIETALIVERNLPRVSDDSRQEAAVVAALLHDVIDDTATDISEIEEQFGSSVAGMVALVSKMSQVNQLLRRDKRTGLLAGDWLDKRRKLRSMMVDAVMQEPLAILIKLSDRLHNMRTVYALPPEKAQAVAEETLHVWCTMAEYLGWHGLKSEMEDLCFAVLQTEAYCRLRLQLDRLWDVSTLPQGFQGPGFWDAPDDQAAQEQQQQEVLQEAAGEQLIDRVSMVHTSVLQNQLLPFTVARRSKGAGKGADGKLRRAGYAVATRQQAGAGIAVPAVVVQDSSQAKDGTPGSSAGSSSGGTDPARCSSSSSSSSSSAGSSSSADSSGAVSGGAVSGGAVSGGVGSSMSSMASVDEGEACEDLSRAQDILQLYRCLRLSSSSEKEAARQEGSSSSSSSGSGSGSGQVWQAPGATASRPQDSSSTPAASAAMSSTPADAPPTTTASSTALPTAPSPPAALPLTTPPTPTPTPLTPEQQQLKQILATVVPFDAVGFKAPKDLSYSARRGLEVLDQCANELYTELTVASFLAGLDVTIQGRLKSLYSVHKKMQRKGCSLDEVYDSRALRVIVDDEDGARSADALAACYRLLNRVHTIWKPIPRELDDYIANPKPSGYRALHTAVRGPKRIPMEVQIKTSSMHEHAEYGGASHWAYKEDPAPAADQPAPAAAAVAAATAVISGEEALVAGSSSGSDVEVQSGSAAAISSSSSAAEQLLLSTTSPAALPAPSALPPAVLPSTSSAAAQQLPLGYPGQPVLRIGQGNLRYGVVLRRSPNGQRLLCAIKSGETAREHPTRVPDYQFYANLVMAPAERGWGAPGHGDLEARLEEFVMCKDGRYHRQDHMGVVHSRVSLTLLEGYEQEACAALAQLHSNSQQQSAEGAAAALDAGSSADAAADGAASAAAADGDDALAPPSLDPSFISLGSEGDDPWAAMPNSGSWTSMSASATAGLDGPDGSSSSSSADTGASLPWPQGSQKRRSSLNVDSFARSSTASTASEADAIGDSPLLRGQLMQTYQKTQQLRSMLEWGKEVSGAELAPSDDVTVLIWPGGKIENFPRGTTAGVVVGQKGIVTVEGGAGRQQQQRGRTTSRQQQLQLVNVNNHLVPKDTVLHDGDLVILAQERLKI